MCFFFRDFRFEKRLPLHNSKMEIYYLKISKSLSPNGESVDIELNGNLDFGQMYVYPKNN